MTTETEHEFPLPGLTPRRTNVRPWWQRADGNAKTLSGVVDPIIDALPMEGRHEMAAVWQERANSELKVGSTFCAVTNQVIEHGADEMVLTLLSQAMRDEVYHTQISCEMAARFRGAEQLVWPGPQHSNIPLFAPAEPKLRTTLLVLTLCCINETVACGVLEGQIAKVGSPLTKAAAQAILSDEIDHARAGWAHLASRHVGPELLGQIGSWLPRLLSARLNELAKEAEPFPGEQFPDLGVLPRRERKVIIRNTLHEVMLPGFARTGIDVGPATQWADETFGKREAA